MDNLTLLLIALLIVTYAVTFTRHGRAAFDATVLLILVLLLLGVTGKTPT